MENKMKTVEIGKSYYFNNRPIVILKRETESMVLVTTKLNIQTDTKGSNFCTECNVGSTNGTPHSHECFFAQEVIDQIIAETEDVEAIMWIDIRYIHEHPFEYKEDEKLKKSIQDNKEILNILNQQINDYKQIIAKQSKEYSDLQKCMDDIKRDYDSNLNNFEILKQKIISLKTDENITIENMKLSLTFSELKRLVISHINMQFLEKGGVDNWEWYGESFPDNWDEDEEAAKYILNEFVKK